MLYTEGGVNGRPGLDVARRVIRDINSAGEHVLNLRHLEVVSDVVVVVWKQGYVM